MPKVSTSFKPGQSGNPKGRPKSSWTWSGLLREFAEQEIDGKTRKELIAEALASEAVKGNVPAIKEFGDRIDGKAQQAVDVTSKGESLTGITVSFDGGED